MAIFFKKNCLYMYERYKETEKQTTTVKPPHKHIRDINQTLEKEKYLTYYLLNLLHTSHYTLHFTKSTQWRGMQKKFSFQRLDQL